MGVLHMYLDLISHSETGANVLYGLCYGLYTNQTDKMEEVILWETDRLVF